MFEDLPDKFKNPIYFVIGGFIASQIVQFFSAITDGKTIVLSGCSFLGNCYSIVPVSQAEWGAWMAWSLGFLIGSLIFYWWEIGRKKANK
ncbi:MAG: hypothetical protein HOJ20_13225 [Rhodospirillaceae bacterium]|jgi:hypothetical protein|nr:hypothetical protein [Rhodospirillaceae bacterium]